MIKIGNTNLLTVKRFTQNGAYLAAPDAPHTEVLLPTRYVTPDLKEGQEVKVFVYTDSEDRPVATTETPFAQAGEFAYLQVVDVNRVGAFMDWGVLKHLLVPFSEQKVKMRPGGIYLVYVYLDRTTGRVVASAKTDKFLGNVYPDYRPGNKVQALITEHTPIGYKTIVDNLHKGMIYSNEIYQPLELEETITAYVKNIRDDGKIDLTLTAPSTQGRINRLAGIILEMIATDNMPLTEKSAPEQVSEVLHCSKKDFKKTISALYRQRRIEILPDGSYKLATAHTLQQ